MTNSRIFSQLTVEEIEKLSMAPIWVTLLIAGADEKVDKKEIGEAMQLVQDKKNVGNEAIRTLYSRADKFFENNLKGYMALFSENGEARKKYLHEQLSSLNSLLRRMDRSVAIEYYEGLKDLSERVARASGGLFGIGGIGKEEAEFINLPMIEDPGKLPI